eukprot:CAMPEP_0194214178 /NCGR_PEP_ID=MMETSP0156-20130528/15309_1 /TAXON_ID=33649 /ORGANISM="Thalassionema nitzschioides, Strain L26-B" /LENGTH=173 /DNA_ID=CAMNT_0038942397 /DNA_START=77 /DNA_END=598 /DNA_ORIENTATION=+
MNSFELVALRVAVIFFAITNVAVSLSTPDRRSFLGIGAATTSAALGITQPAYADEEIKVDAFNGLIFNYRGNKFNGLDASDLDEPSVSFIDFGERLRKGQVAFVKFYAPDGDKAYVTFKTEEGKTVPPIRIGEGFPIEQHDGYSSPAFVVRALQNFDVPYEFVVPGLEKYKNM